MHTFRITCDRVITLDLIDLLWACNYLWSECGQDFNTIDEIPLSLAGRILQRKGYPVANFNFANGNVNDFTSDNIVCRLNNHKGYKGYSPYRGVTYHYGSGRWVSQLTLNGEKVLYKKFKTEIDAVNAYDAMCIKLGLLDRVNKKGS